MKLITFEAASAVRCGLDLGDVFVDLDAAGRALGVEGIPPGETVFGASLDALLRRGGEALEAAQRLARALEERARDGRLPGPREGVFPARESRRLAPLARPGKIVCVGRNYADHCAEQNRTPPDRPLFFLKASSAVVGDGAPIEFPPEVTGQCDYEGELAVVVGKRGRSIDEERALEHVAGYTIVNDVTARDLQRDEKQWARAKGLDTFCPMGPGIVTRDEIPDPHLLGVRTFVNGEPRQSSSTRHLVFRIPELLSRLSRGMTLEPGDVLSTGTPGGVGAFLDPPQFLRDGDEVRIEIDRIGSLTNPVRESERS